MIDPGYITDVEYSGGFVEHQNPAQLNYIATLNGYGTPPIDREFTYCELGCGKGLTSLMLAATYPQGRFWACDLNAAHIRYAKDLAEAGKVENLQLLQRSVGQMLADRKLPAFDFITMHGLYSWVPDAVRAEIHAFLKAKLKPGGLAMVSYNAMPGWANILPIRRMMTAYAAGVQGDSREKARQALAYVRHLAENKAVYFNANPAAADYVARIANTTDLNYLAHEYITPHGDPFYFSEVNEAMREAGLAFAGNMEPRNNYSELMVPGQFKDLMATAPTRTILETHRDFIANTRFRNDLYAAQAAVPRAQGVPLARIAGQFFRFANRPANLALQGVSGGIQYNLEPMARSVQAVHQLLTPGPATGAQIRAVSNLLDDSEGAAFIQQLVLAGHVTACGPAPEKFGWNALSSAMVALALKEKAPRALLPCWRTGTAHHFEIAYAAAIEATVKFDDPDAAARSAIERLTGAGLTLNASIGSNAPAKASNEDAHRYFHGLWRMIRDPASADRLFLGHLGVL